MAKTLSDIPGAGDKAHYAESLISAYEDHWLTFDEAWEQLEIMCRSDVLLYFYEHELMACRSLRKGQ